MSHPYGYQDCVDYIARRMHVATLLDTRTVWITVLGGCMSHPCGCQDQEDSCHIPMAARTVWITGLEGFMSHPYGCQDCVDYRARRIHVTSIWMLGLCGLQGQEDSCHIHMDARTVWITGLGGCMSHPYWMLTNSPPPSCTNSPTVQYNIQCFDPITKRQMHKEHVPRTPMHTFSR